MIFLSCFDAKWKGVLRGGKDTGCISCESTRRAVSIVEINNDLAVFYWFGVVVTTWRIGFFFAGLISKLDEEFVVLCLGDIKFISLSFESEGEISVNTVFDHIAKCIRMVHHLGLFIACITRGDAEMFVDREPFQGREREAFAAFIIPDADGIPASVFVEDKPQSLAPCDEAGVRLCTGP